MIRDLEKELVSVRNLLEVAVEALIYMAKRKSRLGNTNRLVEELQRYNERRAERFAMEEEDANQVMEKVWRASGEDTRSVDWVPREEFEKLRASIAELAKDAGYTRN